MSTLTAPVVWPHRDSPLKSRRQLPEVKPVMLKATAQDVKSLPAWATSTRAIRIVMAGGGTGGHLYPGLAVAEALKERLGDRLTILWAATPRPVDQRLLGGFGDAYIKQPVQPLVKKVGKILPFIRGWRQSCAYWKQTFSQAQADAVLALGGYAAGPAAYVAGKFGIPVGLLNPDALPGLANRFLLKRAEKVFVQWSLPANSMKSVRGRVMPLGCPIRKDLLACTRMEAAAKLGLDPLKKTLVITGASLGAKTINDAMILLLRDEEFRNAISTDYQSQIANHNSAWQLLHLAGTDQANSVRAEYERTTNIAYKVLDYCDDMASVWALADLAIARAGASTCAELAACGVPSILMPYPYHRDNHQRHNAEQLEKEGAALIVDDQKDSQANAIALKPKLMSLLYDESTRHQMAQQARIAGKPEAAGAIAEELLAMIRM
jgi:UDP-N-acetylglucosamine--N-acetylmuramyl-(pentapeptide) pyrophosphoryl-undecaprenol N-acetylglucosamine transferase